MPPLPHEPAGFYNDCGATVDIPLDSTKVTDFHCFCYYCGILYFTSSVLAKTKNITMIFHSNTLKYVIVVHAFLLDYFFLKVMYNVIDQGWRSCYSFLDVGFKINSRYSFIDVLWLFDYVCLYVNVGPK